ncbi:hypothetical protein [Maribacter sp.]|uniref:hypothetical protein n=1 Tax=Maribacter sp. TaxID=1897614 RepID=UPI003299899C
MKKLLLHISLLFSLVALAQDEIKLPELDTGNQVYTLEFSPDSQNKEVISAYMQGETEKDSLRFWAEGTILIQNVMVTVLSPDKNTKIKVDIVKNNWEDSKINGYLEDGVFQESFNTAGKFGIVVSSVEPGKLFYLAIWTSGELIPDMSRLYYPASEKKSITYANNNSGNIDNIDSSTNTNYLMFAIIAILVIIAIFLGLMILRKNKGALLLLFMIFLGGNKVLHAQASSLQEVVLNDLLEEYTGVKDLMTYSRNLQDAGYLGRQRPLDPIDDADSEADVNPAGIPNLPSSCMPPRYGTTTFGGSAVSGNLGSSTMGIGSSSSPNTEGNSTDENSDNDASKNLNDDESGIPDNKVQEYEAEKNRLRNEHHELDQQAQESYDEQIEFEDKLYERLMDAAQAQYSASIDAANGDATLLSTFSTAYANQTSSLSSAHLNRTEQYLTQFQEQNSRNDASLEHSLKKLRERYQDSNDEDSKNEEDQNDESKGLGNDSGNSNMGGQSSNNSSTDQSSVDNFDSESTDTPNNNISEPSNSNPNENNNEGCNCLDRAYIELDKRRLNLERLRIIYSHSMKKIKAGIAFGDNVSGVHGVSGLAWQSQKMIILKESIPTLNKAYDDKYAEMIEALEENLKEIDRCEAMLGYENWYNHAGFIYYQFMADKYKRN